jgi:hypothetical protein
MNTFPWNCLAVAALALVASGCGGGGPRLYKAGGTVTDNNVPVEGAQVTFAYDDGNIANGFTDAAGKFQLNYMNHSGVAAPGKCKVSVSKRGGATGPTTTIDFKTSPKSEAEYKAREQERKKMMERQVVRDATGGSGDFTKSGLVLEITTDESKNNFAINLQDLK